MEVTYLDKKTIIIIAIALIAGFVIAGVVAQLINTYVSLPVDVTVEDYTLTLTVDMTTCAVGDTLNFSGTFTTSSFYIEGQNVTLWCDGAYTGLWAETNAEGYYEILYVTTTAGSFSFYTNATITD